MIEIRTGTQLVLGRFRERFFLRFFLKREKNREKSQVQDYLECLAALRPLWVIESRRHSSVQ
jgi:hypothetical protein